MCGGFSFTANTSASMLLLLHIFSFLGFLPHNSIWMVHAEAEGNNNTCGFDEVALFVEIQPDRYPEDISYIIFSRSDTGLFDDFLLSYYFEEGMLAKYNTTYCIDPSPCYIFEIRDSEGDGLCCYYGDGWYRVTYDDAIVMSGRKFDSSEVSTQFGDSCSSESPSFSSSPTAAPTAYECSPRPSSTFTSVGGLITAVCVVSIYIFLLCGKVHILEICSEVAGQFIATTVAVGFIFICQNDEKVTNSTGVVMSMTSLLAIGGFELILTFMTVPFMDDYIGGSFDKERWDQLDGCAMCVVRFLIWCIGCGLPLVILFLDYVEWTWDDDSRLILIPCFVSLGLGMIIGLFGPCVLIAKKCTGGGTRLLWQLIKLLVGVIPGLIVAIAKKNWFALGWGAELFIELSHYFSDFISG